MPKSDVVMPEVSQIHRHSERSVPDEAASILAAGLVAHIGFNDGDEPQVMPFLYHYDPQTPNRLYLHGAVANHTLRLLTNGTPICVTVTLIDGLVYSRTAPNHSANYRSVVCTGRGQVVSSDEEKEQMFTAMIGRYFDGREQGRDYAPSTLKDLRTTTVVAVQIERWGAKARRGGPLGPSDADPGAPGTCGVVETALGLLQSRPGRNEFALLQARNLCRGVIYHAQSSYFATALRNTHAGLTVPARLLYTMRSIRLSSDLRVRRAGLNLCALPVREAKRWLIRHQGQGVFAWCGGSGRLLVYCW